MPGAGVVHHINRDTLAGCRLLPVFTQHRTWRCTARTDAMCQLLWNTYVGCSLNSRFSSRRPLGPLCHVWTAPSWQELFSRFAALVGAAMCSAFDAVHMTAGHNALRGSGPDQQLAFKNAMAHVGCPDRRIDRLCVTCCSPSQPSHHARCPARSRLSRKRDGFLVSLAPGHHGPDHSGDLVGERDSRNLGRPPRQQGREPGPMFGAMDLGVADDGERAGHEQAAQIAVLPSLFLPPLECCFGTSPIQAEKFRPDRKDFGSATAATKAVASTGPTPGASSSLMLISLDRCQALISRSNSSICSLIIRN